MTTLGFACVTRKREWPIFCDIIFHNKSILAVPEVRTSLIIQSGIKHLYSTNR